MTNAREGDMTDATSTPIVQPPSPESAASAGGAAAAAQAADAAPATGTLTLVAPGPVAAIAPTQAEDAIKLDPADVARLNQMADEYVAAVTSLDVKAPAFAAKADDIRKLGDDDIRASADVSRRLLDKPVAAIENGGIAPASEVSKSLIALRRTVEDLDPQHQGDLLSPSKLLGLIPFGNKLRDYFAKYQSSQTHIDAIIRALYHGQDELQKDNADIEQEKVNLWATMNRLRQYIYLAQELDKRLSAKISEIEANDPERARVMREDLLFYVRQKVQDLLTQLAVSIQGYLALDLIRRNNLELVKGVDRATTTTVSALRTAVVVAQALADQKLVLDQISALNTTTGNLIESTSQMLRQQSSEVMQQASSSTIDLAKLQAAFQNIYATMDEIDGFKLKALDNMARTIEVLETETKKAQWYLDRVRDRDARDPQSTGAIQL
jgi:uncharacterized protein YaaN involved in tellurite resistance